MTKASRIFGDRTMEQQTSIFTRVNAWAAQSGAVNLGQGFPDHHPPELLLSSVQEALRENYYQYVPSFGLLGLRQQIARIWEEDFAISLDFNTQITVTAGATQALHDATVSILSPEDEVLILDPSYDSYAPVVRSVGAVPVRVPMNFSPELGFSLDWERIRASIGPKTKLWIINNPHNPSGYTWSSADFQEVELIMNDYPDLFVLGDEVYAYLAFDPLFKSLLSLESHQKRILVVHSFGKTYHCTGWKLGYAAGSEPWMHKLRQHHEYNVFCVNSLMQRALEIFLPQDTVRRDIATFYLEQRDFLFSLLDSTPIRAAPVQGTYFQWLDFSFLSKATSDLDLAQEWALKAGCAMIPFSPFMEKSSPQNPLLMRLCFAKSKQKMELGLGNLRHYLGF
ncbi:MAG: aminotransferase class I/II-fold pyridoxal phosphate-dependent enzyme [Bacteroidota bacterium]